MGMTEVRVRVVNLAHPSRSAELDMVVDSGAIYSIVPAGEALGLRLDPLRRQLRPLRLMIA